MPMYQTLNADGSVIGVYGGQRPSVAACKAFTTLRRQGREAPMCIHVVTEGRKLSRAYDVNYAVVQDPFLGSMSRPVATARLDTLVGDATTQ